MLEFKIDVIAELKSNGYNVQRIRNEKLLAQNTLTQIRRGQVPSAKSIDIICRLLNKQPGTIIRWVPDPEEEGAE